MASKKPALGRNLGVLLGEVEKDKQTSGEAVQQMTLAALQPGKYQPRQDMDTEALQSLAESIKEQGIIQPLVVRKISAKKYEIVAGERRWRAAKLAGLSKVPVVVRELSDQTAMAMALIENIQREDLNPLEEAYALQRLIDEFGLTHEQAAKAVGRSRTAVTNLLRLLSLSAKVKSLLDHGDIEMGHARALLSLDNHRQELVVQEIIEHGLNVRQTEELVRQVNSEQPATTGTRHKPSVDPDILRLQTQLSEQLKAKVTIDHKASGKGKLVIKYNSLEQFETILVELQN